MVVGPTCVVVPGTHCSPLAPVWAPAPLWYLGSCNWNPLWSLGPFVIPGPLCGPWAPLGSLDPVLVPSPPVIPWPHYDTTLMWSPDPLAPFGSLGPIVDPIPLCGSTVPGPLLIPRPLVIPRPLCSPKAPLYSPIPHCNPGPHCDPQTRL